MNMILRVMRLMTFLMPSIFLLANLGQAAMLFYGGGQIIDGTLTLGEYQKFSLYLVFVFIPVGQLGFIITQMAQAASSADRVFEIIDTENDVADAADAEVLSKVRGDLAFEDVTFRYFGGSDVVLNGVNFSAKSGETVAFVGDDGLWKIYDH